MESEHSVVMDPLPQDHCSTAGVPVCINCTNGGKMKRMFGVRYGTPKLVENKFEEMIEGFGYGENGNALNQGFLYNSCAQRQNRSMWPTTQARLYKTSGFD